MVPTGLFLGLERVDTNKKGTSREEAELDPEHRRRNDGVHGHRRVLLTIDCSNSKVARASCKLPSALYDRVMPGNFEINGLLFWPMIAPLFLSTDGYVRDLDAISRGVR